MKTKIIRILFISLILIINFFVILGVEITKAYTPPIGIPDPGMWGNTHPIDSVAPSTEIKCPTWPSSQTDNCYYIDNTNPNSTDKDNPYGYPNKPRATIPAGTYVAGSYIEVHGGPYITSATRTMNGTAENPIWFRGTSSQAKPIFKAKQSFTNSSYLFIENLEFSDITGGSIVFFGMNTHHVILRNSYFHDMTYPGGSTSVIGATPTQSGSMHDMIFYNNNFHIIGDWKALEDDDYHCIAPGLWGRTPPTTIYNFWVLNNTADQVSGNLVQFNGDQRDAGRGDSEVPIRLITNTNMQNSHHHYVGKNIMHHSRQSISSQKFSTDVIVSQNYGHDNYSHSSDGASGEVYQEGANYVWFLFNRFHNQDWGIRQSNTNFDTPNGDALTGIPSEEMANLHMYAIGNSIEYTHNTKGNNYKGTSPRNHAFKIMQAFCSEKGHYTRYVIDNTIYNTGGGFNFTNYKSRTELSGNVIAGVQGFDLHGDPEYHGSIFRYSLSDPSEEIMDYSFFQPRADDGTVRFRWFTADDVAISPTSLQDLQSATDQCKNCWSGNPLFVDANNYNLHPQENSPLIGKGIRHAVYDEFKSRYGISIDYDFDGNPRPKNATRTLGAFEYTSNYILPIFTPAQPEPVVRNTIVPIITIPSTPAPSISLTPTRSSTSSTQSHSLTLQQTNKNVTESVNNIKTTSNTGTINNEMLNTKNYVKQLIISKGRLNKTNEGKMYINAIDLFVNRQNKEELLILLKKIGLLRNNLDLKTSIKYANVLDYLEGSIGIKFKKI